MTSEFAVRGWVIPWREFRVGFWLAFEWDWRPALVVWLGVVGFRVGWDACDSDT